MTVKQKQKTEIAFSPALENASEEEIQQLQLRKLQYQVEYLYERNPFYREKMKAGGVTPRDIKSLDDLRRIPPSTKQDFIEDQKAHLPYGTRLGIPEDKVAQVHITSGTSGHGQEVHGISRSDQELMLELSNALWTWAGLRPTQVGSSMVPVTNSAAGSCMRESIMMVGRYPIHVGHMPYGERLDWLSRFGVGGMYGMPSYLQALATLCEERGWDPKERFPDFEMYVLAGEAYPVAWARRMEEFWGIKLHETYGSTQTAGTCASCTCLAGALNDGNRGRIHLFEWSILYELINPETGEHVAPGEEGEIYVTTLDREGSPMLRFASRDRARWFPARESGCGCGLPFAAFEAGTIGRLDDMLKIKGVNVWPASVDDVMFSNPEVQEYRATVTINERGRTEVIMETALSDSAPSSEADRRQFLEKLGLQLRDAVGISFSIKEVAIEDLPPFEFKARRWSDERQEKMDS